MSIIYVFYVLAVVICLSQLSEQRNLFEFDDKADVVRFQT